MPNLSPPPSFITQQDWWPNESAQWLEILKSSQDTRALIGKTHATLADAYEQGTPISEIIIGYAMSIDYILWHAWYIHELHNKNAVLLATGGYGRFELHIYSDIDLMILLSDDFAAKDEPALSQFLTYLWDIGLEVGHSVRTIGQTRTESEKDITVITSLIESRPICGNVSLYNALVKATSPDQMWASHDFYHAKKQELVIRHQKYGDTSYQLEPNIKEGPGGMRDIQFIEWIGKRHFGVRSLADLVACGFLQEKEYLSLRYTQEYLWRIRFGLQSIAKRKEDRLLFNYQLELARQFGFSDQDSNLAVEQFMQNFYRHITESLQLTELLGKHFEEFHVETEHTQTKREVNSRFHAKGNKLYLNHNKVFERYPFALLELFLILQQHQDISAVSSTLIRAIRDHLHLIDDDFRDDIRNRSLFIEIMRQPKYISSALHRMHRYGVLGAYWPAFGRVIGRMQYDLYHVFTVDQHTLAVLSQATHLADPEREDLHAIFNQLPKPELLYLAALFHDIAKGRGGDHSTLGAEDAQAFCLSHGLSNFDASLVSWLVTQHLSMSITAQQKDVSEPSVIHEFANLVGNTMRLNYLYLLTVADIKGTNPKLWNSWRAALLKKLYESTLRYLRGGQQKINDSSALIEDTKQSSLRLLTEQNFEVAQIESFWDELEDDYFLRHTDDEIAWHAEIVLSDHEHDRAHISIRQKTVRGCTEIFIYSRDRNYLFAHITECLTLAGLSVNEARIITSKKGHALDTFLVLDREGKPIKDPEQCAQLQSHIESVLEFTEESTNFANHHIPRRLKHFWITPQVHFQKESEHGHTVIEILATDYPGLLANLAQVFAEFSISVHNARISTLGERAHDFFYITDQNQQPLSDLSLRQQLKNRLIERIGQYHPDTDQALVI